MGNKFNRGYTILETMISIAIFLVIVEFGMGSLLGANNMHQKSQDMRAIFDSLNFVMDDLSRSLRTGYNYQCFRKGTDTLSSGTLGAPQSCTDGWAIAFESDVGNPADNNDQIVFYISPEGKIRKSTDGAVSFVDLTTDEIIMETISGFSVLGAEKVVGSNNRQQPLITMRFSGKIIYRSIETPFQLQTTASQRLVDI